MLLLNGRIAGVSGIVGGLVNPKAGDTGWRAAFVIGLPLGALAYILVAGGPAPVDVLASPPAILIGGLLVRTTSKLAVHEVDPVLFRSGYVEGVELRQILGRERVRLVGEQNDLRAVALLSPPV